MQAQCLAFIKKPINIGGSDGGSQYSINITCYFGLGTELNTFNPPNNLMKCHYFPPITNEETEAQKTK